MTTYQTLVELAAAFGLDEAQTDALDRYVDAVLAWPGNVTALHRRQDVVDTLLGDALALLDVPHLVARDSWLDLGSGAGIPGVPLAIARPHARVTLLESSTRKCAFLRRAVSVADLGDRGRVLCERSEQHAAAGQPGRDAYEVVLARAVASLPALVELAAPLLTTGGVLLASKTASAAAAEGVAARRVAQRCGLVAGPVVSLPRSPLDDAACAVYEKTGPTPCALPRRPGMAAKRPLGS